MALRRSSNWKRLAHDRRDADVPRLGARGLLGARGRARSYPAGAEDETVLVGCRGGRSHRHHATRLGTSGAAPVTRRGRARASVPPSWASAGEAVLRRSRRGPARARRPPAAWRIAQRVREGPRGGVISKEAPKPGDYSHSTFPLGAAVARRRRRISSTVEHGLAAGTRHTDPALRRSCRWSHSSSSRPSCRRPGCRR
jgi:hypothetical protein